MDVNCITLVCYQFIWASFWSYASTSSPSGHNHGPYSKVPRCTFLPFGFRWISRAVILPSGLHSEASFHFTIRKSWPSYQDEPSFHLSLGESQGRWSSQLGFSMKFRFIVQVGSQSLSIFQPEPLFHFAWGDSQEQSSSQLGSIQKRHTNRTIASLSWSPVQDETSFLSATRIIIIILTQTMNLRSIWAVGSQS